MSTVKRIQELLDCAVKVPLYDGTGKIVTPAGADAVIEAKTLKRCLKIAQEEADAQQIFQAK
jgi:hypothetical protein